MKMSLDNQLKECDKLYDNGDFEGLIKKCDKILEEFPDNPNAMGYKGFSCYALGDDDEALNILKSAVELHPDNYYLKNNLAMVYYELCEYETALKLCNDGLEISEFDWLCQNKFKNLIKLERYDEAIDLEEANPDLCLPLIFIEEDMKSHEMDYYTHRLNRNPDDFAAKEMIKSLENKD